MPQTPHVERHFTAGHVVRDAVIGMSDGLTVPFALAAGLAGAVTSTQLIATAGLAELAAGAIAMGLGGYLASRSDADHYASERAREVREVAEMQRTEESEVRAVFRDYGLTREEIEPVIRAFRARPDAWVDFMMRFELGIERPEPGRALRSAIVIGGSYVVGGMIPLLPYLLLGDPQRGLVVSAIVTLLALLVFGFVKGRFTGAGPVRSALQTALVGSVAAGAAYAIARLVAG